MTNEEAIKVLKGDLHAWIPESYVGVRKHQDAVLMAIEALEKAEKYKWHDLRKNPEDLPEEGKTVNIIYGDGRHESASRELCLHNGYQWTNRLCYFSDVIAWQETDPFEEEE